MKSHLIKHLLMGAVFSVSTSLYAVEFEQVEGKVNSNTLYQAHCAACHGADRLGQNGPALLPGNLARLRKADSIKTIAEGRIATQMPGFSDKLNLEEIKALSDLIYTPLATTPSWDLTQMRASRIVHKTGKLSDKPVFKADPLNVFVVVELGDHHASILDGDRFEVITRFPTRYALHGGPKFSPDGRYVYFASRDGWVAKYDIWNLKLISEIRVGINTRNLAISSDGKYAMIANYLPHSIVILDTDNLMPIKSIDVSDANGKSSRVSAVYDAAPRNSFIAALKDIPEVWEFSYVNSTHKKSKIQPNFEPRKILLDDFVDDFFFDTSYTHLIGSAREGVGQVIDLNAGKKIHSLALAGMPHLGSGITWEYQGKSVLATPNLKEGLVTVVDMSNWSVTMEIPTLGPGFFMRSHEKTPYAWVDVFNGRQDRDVIQIIDKQNLNVVAQLKPSPGKVAAHTEFTRDGKYALVSIWENEGELVVYDASTLEIVKRLPMKKPSGKYNVFNKISRSNGTSH
jgi:DNA-binding beta-propeller fold protein YncE/cytochrome c553